MIFDNPFSRWAIRITGSFIALAASASVASAATITVTTGLDQYGTGAPGECSLREAIQSANQDSNFDQCVGVGPYGNDVIVFTPTVTLVQLTITTGLTSNDDNSFLDLDIRDINPPGALVIDGGPNSVTIQPGILSWTDRIFDIPQVGGQPSPVTLRNLTIQGGGPTLSNETPPIGDPCFNSGGGVRNWSGGALTLENVTIQNNTMPANGGGVCQSGSGALTVLTSTIQNNVATIRNGGGIAYLGTGALLVQSSTVLSNSAGTDGGGIYDQSSALTVQNSQVLSNTVNNAFSGGTGGGVWTAGGTSPKQIVTSTVAFNRAGGDGGGIWNQTSSGLQLFNSTVLSNTAGAFQNNPGNGGGIWSERPLTIGNSQVLSNTAFYTGTFVTPPPGGGGIYHQASPSLVPPLTINNSQVAHNLARALNGPVIAGGGIWNSGIATLNTVTVEHNLADGVQMGGRAYGGGIHNEERLTLNNSQVRHNRADWFSANGGGVSNESNSPGGSAEFTLSASSVSTNTAQGDPNMGGFAGGGGIYSTGTADLLAGEVRNNLAAGGQSAGGGGVDSNGILTVTSSLVISNAATASLGGSNGGGIQTGGSAALITNTQIYTNTAGNGGGWYNTVFSAQLNNSDVRFNEAATKDGGGVYNLGNNVQINDSAICQNQAQQHGGGVYNGAPILIGQTTICLNQAGLGGVGDGGGIYNNVNGGLQVMMSQVLTNTTVDNGGGIYNASPNSGILNSTVQSNTASAGGGVYNAAGSMLIDMSTLRTNQASGDGGGAYNADQMFVVASTVQSNTAGSLGGGVYNASSATGLLVNVSTLRGNNAASGGGLYNESSANVSFSALVNNIANFGGGVGNAPGGALSSENNTFSGNSAPNGSGLDVAAGSSAYLTFTTVASNTAGNGIVVASGGTAEVYATLLAYNAGNNCAGTGTVTDNGFSMSDDGSCTSFTFNSSPNPLLQPLALNGGQTLNHALSPGSPALDQVPTPCPLSFDQRFVSRPQGTDCDIGAFELEAADLEVSKTADPSPVIAGQTITYTVIVTNVSTSGFANNVVLTDTLLGGTTFGGVVSGGGFTLQSSSSSQAVFTLPSLAASSSVTLVFTATAPAGGPITNTATVASGNPDPVLSNNTASVETPVTPAAYLAVSKAQDFVPYAPGVVLPSATVTYTIVVTNNGPSTPATVGIVDTLASGVSFMAAGGSGWTCTFSAPNVNCSYGPPLPPGSSASVLITVTAPVTPSTVFTNAADGFAGAFPGGPFASNVVTLTTAANAELRLFKTATPAAVFAGQLVTYVVAVQNFGPDVATNLVITDVFQGGASFGSVLGVSGGATLQSSSSTAVTFTVTSLGVGNSAVMTYTVVAPADGVITNTATVASDAVDPAPANNVFSTTTPVTPVVNLVVNKSAAPTLVLPGQTVTYVVTVNNAGPSTATGVVITDVFQGGASFGSVVATSGGATYQSNTSTAVTFTVPSLSAGNSAVMTYTVTAPTSGVITNTATAGAAELDSNPANNTASTTVTVTTGTDVRVVKTTPITQALAGQPVFYSVVVLNLGPLTATNIVITDVIQGGATFGGVVATSGGATLQSSTSTAVTFTVPALPVGGLAVVVYSIIAPPTGTITNTVTVAATEFDPQPANNTATVTTPVIPVANLSISKAPSFPTAIAGTITPSAQLTYTILVTNSGPSSATSVTVTDNLPAGLTFVSATGSGWSCSNSGQTVTCTVSSLSMGAAPAIQIVASAPVTPGLVLTNTAVVNAATFPNTPVTSNSVVVKVQFRAFLPIARLP
jgi:uncharacterized repeat protein (TIGR01451 family)/CSLREA domain-containing protein